MDTLKTGPAGNTTGIEGFGDFLGRPGTRERLVRLAGRMLGKDEAEDAAHDGVVQALSSSSAFRQQAQISTWMHRVVVNASLMRLRKSRRQAAHLTRTVPAMPDAPWLGTAESCDPPAADLEREQDIAEVRAAIRALPPGYREVIERCVLGEEPPEVAARALGISPSGVHTRIGRARKQLGAALASRHGVPGDLQRAA